MRTRGLSVLWVATYPELGPSTRYRICQFLPGLRDLGVESTFLPLLSNDFYREFYEPGRVLQKGAGLLAASMRRLKDAVLASFFDVVVVQREAALIGPPFFEYLAKKVARRPIVFDLDDAIFISPGDTRQASVHRRFARILKDPKKADRIARMADEIIVANDFCAEWGRSHSDRVTIIPTVVDGDIFRPSSSKSNRKPMIGWIGSHSAGPQLEIVLPVLERLGRKHDFRLKVVGAGRDVRVSGVDVENLPWSLEREVDDFAGLDIGICPLFDDEWSRGKPGFKPMIYMACGVPQVSSPIGGVTGLLRGGETGFFATTEDEWYVALDKLLSSEALRASMGAAARIAFERGSTLKTETPRLHDVIVRAAASGTSFA